MLSVNTRSGRGLLPDELLNFKIESTPKTQFEVVVIPTKVGIFRKFTMYEIPAFAGMTFSKWTQDTKFQDYLT
jgi:hypothetical protein